MSGRSIGAAIGGIVGSIFPVIGTQIGALAGSLIGGAIDPDRVEGPHLADTRIQISSYGACLTLVYGGSRVAGNVIWAAPLVESSVESSGKGGPVVTNFSYAAFAAIAITGNEIGAIRKAWGDGKLIYDISETADGATQAASANFAKYFTAHLGAADQLPDSTIESFEGVGNVPGYQGVSLGVLDGLPVDDFGKRLPQLTFEVTDKSATAILNAGLAPLFVNAWDAGGGAPVHLNGDTEYFVSAPGEENYTTDDFDAAIAKMLEYYGEDFTEVLGYYSSVVGSEFSGYPGADTMLGEAQYAYIVFARGIPPVLIDGDDSGLGYLYCTPWQDAGLGVGDVGMLSGISGHSQMFTLLAPGDTPSDEFASGWEIVNNCINYPPDGGFPVMWRSADLPSIRAERKPTAPVQTCGIGDPCELGIAQVPGTPGACIDCDGNVTPNLTYTQVSGSYVQLQAYEPGGDGTVAKLPLGPVVAASDPLATDEDYWTAAAADAGLSGTYGVDWPVAVLSVAAGESEYQSAEAGSTTLAAIVTDICLRAGLTEDQIDVSELDDEVLGYKIARQMTARQALEPLRQSFFFDAVQTGNVIRFPKRGNHTGITIGPDDLGASENGDSGPLVRRTRRQESELPAVVNVVYECRDADYQNGAQSARRTATTSVLEVTVELPVTMTDQKGAEVASVLMDDAWSGRVDSEWSTTRAYTHLEPTDVIDLDDGEFVYTVRITEKSEEGPVIKWKGMDTDPAAYSPNVTPSVTSGGAGPIRFDGPMKTVPMNLPTMRAVDDGPAFHLAVTGYRPTFHGGRVYRSINEGADYTSIKDVSAKASIGYATNVLGTFLGGNTVDEVNELIVRMHSGELATITLTQLLNDGNAFAFGVDGRMEVCQFQRAELIDTNTYRLTGLLRGRLGTEQYMGSHEIGDIFVMLDLAVYRVSQTASDIDLASLLKGVAFGTSLTDAGAIPFTYTAVNLKPLSPANLAVTRLANGSYYARCNRRSRYPVPWLSASALPIAEASEQYLYTVLDGDTVIEQQTVTIEEATLGAADTTYALEQIQELAYPAWALREVSGTLFGISIDDRTSGATQIAEAFDSSGTRTAFSYTLGNVVLQVAHGAVAMYVLAYFLTPTVPALYADTTVYRLPYSDIAAAPISVASASAGAFQGLAFDGTHVWVSDASTDEIHKLDAADLSTLDTFAISSPGADHVGRLFWTGGYLWVVTNFQTLIKWDVATEAEIDRFDVPPDAGTPFITDVDVVDGLLYVRTANKLRVFDAATFSLEAEHAATAVSFLPGRQQTLIGDLVAAVNYPGVLLVDAATGDEVARISVPGCSYTAGFRGDQLLLGMSPTSNYLDMRTRAYQIEAPTTAPDYTGFTLRVQQISAVVGPGYAAETTIE